MFNDDEKEAMWLLAMIWVVSLVVILILSAWFHMQRMEESGYAYRQEWVKVIR